MERRNFLKVLLGTVLAVLCSTAKARTNKANRFTHYPNDLVIDQSGSLGNGAFVIAALSFKEASKISKETARLRWGTRFRCTLSHASRNRWKNSYARSLIDYWIARSDIKVNILVLRDETGLQKLKSIEKLSRYTELVARLLDTSPSGNSRQRRIITQRHFKADRQAQFEKMLTLRSARIDGIIHIDERESDLMQLVDLIAGAVQASQKATLAPVTNATKRGIIKHLMSRLGVTSLENELRHPKCSITFV